MLRDTFPAPIGIEIIEGPQVGGAFITPNTSYDGINFVDLLGMDGRLDPQAIGTIDLKVRIDPNVSNNFNFGPYTNTALARAVYSNDLESRADDLHVVEESNDLRKFTC